MNMKRKICFLCALVIFSISFNAANAQYFGKNKTQYKVFNWKYVETKNFDIYYDSGSKALAEFAAVALENALLSVQTTLNYKLTQRVIVIIYDSHNDFQQTNVINVYLSQGIGGVTELYKNRVIVPFQGSYSQFRHVLHHELVHAVINDMFYGGSFQTAISSSGGFQLPIWINEGLAEWESLGGMDFETDMFMRDLTINESLPQLNRISGYLAYRAGQTFFYFIEIKYGKGKVTEFMNKLRIYRNLDITFRNTFGMDIEEFSEMWQTEIKKIYWPDITVYQSPREFATQLTNHEKDNCFYYSSPAISPDGEQMAFISDRDGGIFSIFVSSTTPSRNKDFRIRRLISSARQQDFEQLNVLTPGISWSPDSKRIAISAKSGGEDAIFLINASTRRYERILLGFSSITSVSWSPDGTKIAFIGIKNSGSDVYYYDLQTKNTVAITEDVFTDAYPIWSFDSKSIYFFSDRGDYYSSNLEQNLTSSNFKIWRHNYKQVDIFNIDIATKKINRITNTPDVPKTSMSISSDNQKLLYVANKNGISNLFELNLTDNKTRILTNSANAITQISATPDGLNLIFSSQFRGGYDIFMLKNPFEKQITIDSLPLTDFKQKIIYKNLLSEEIKQGNNSTSEDFAKSISYGDFKTDFTNQQFLRPNPDVVETMKFEKEKLEMNTENLIERDYEVNFSLDGFVINPAISTFYGVQGSTSALFSDVMGNHQIYISANLLNNLRNSQIYAAYFYNTQIIDYSISLYNYAAYTLNYVPELGDEYWYSYRATGLVTGANYAFDLFKRVVFNLNFVNAAKNNAEEPSFESVNRFLIVPETQFVLDNSLNGIYAPTRGTRMYVKALYSPKIADLSSEFVTLVSDVRQYVELVPHFMSFAFRGSAGVSLGGRPQTFYIGGISNWINATYRSGNLNLDNPEDFAFLTNFVMPLRGWPVLEHTGNKFFVFNAEYRFPIFMALATGGLPLIIQGVMGNIFYDAGAAWTKDFKISKLVLEKNGEEEKLVRKPADLYMSSGWGLRAIVFGLPFKFDMAWRNEYSGWSSPYYLFSLGLDF